MLVLQPRQFEKALKSVISVKERLSKLQILKFRYLWYSLMTRTRLNEKQVYASRMDQRGRHIKLIYMTNLNESCEIIYNTFISSIQFWMLRQIFSHILACNIKKRGVDKDFFQFFNVVNKLSDKKIFTFLRRRIIERSILRRHADNRIH